jgi:hypothetical protein
VASSRRRVVSRQAHSFSSNRKIRHILSNSKVRYCGHKSLALVPVVSSVNPAHILQFCFCKITCNIIPLTAWSSLLSLTGMLSHQNSMWISFSSLATCSDQFSLLSVRIWIVILDAETAVSTSAVSVWLQLLCAVMFGWWTWYSILPCGMNTYWGCLRKRCRRNGVSRKGTNRRRLKNIA